MTCEKRPLRGALGTIATDLLLAAIAAGLFLALEASGRTALAASAGLGTVYRGKSESRAALVCVVSWNASACGAILDTLREHGAGMTFAVSAEFAAENPLLLQRMRAEGHEIALSCGNETENDLGAAAEELSRAARLVERACGARPGAFVCTGGTESAACRAARGLGLTVVAGSRDLVCLRGTAEAVAARAKLVRGGDIALCAPTAAFSEGLPGILEYYSRMGLTAAPLSGTIYD